MSALKQIQNQAFLPEYKILYVITIQETAVLNLLKWAKKIISRFASDTIFSVVREAVTNSIRHGNANKIEVILKFSENCIRLYIIDDGTGCDKIVPDFGLKGMKEKINSIGGNIEFSSLPDNGFSVKAYIPVEVINYD